MFWLQEAAASGAEHAEEVEQAPIIVQFVNHYFGEWAYQFEMTYTHPLWTKFFAKFGTTPEAVFGPYTPETAIARILLFVLVIPQMLVTLTLARFATGGRAAADALRAALRISVGATAVAVAALVAVDALGLAHLFPGGPGLPLTLVFTVAVASCTVIPTTLGTPTVLGVVCTLTGFTKSSSGRYFWITSIASNHIGPAVVEPCAEARYWPPTVWPLSEIGCPC